MPAPFRAWEKPSSKIRRVESLLLMPSTITCFIGGPAKSGARQALLRLKLEQAASIAPPHRAIAVMRTFLRAFFISVSKTRDASA